MAAPAFATALLRFSTLRFLSHKRLNLHRFLPLSFPSSNSQTLHSQAQDATPNVIDILRERGLIESITFDNLRSICSNPNSTPLKVYCGFDPSAESLHLGNLIGIIVLSWFRRCGHKTVALIGSATGRIGDPSGKSLERPNLDVDAIDKNSAEIRAQVCRILHRINKEDFEAVLPKNEKFKSDFKDSRTCLAILDNIDWWREITLLDFLKEVGRYARVGTMMAKESVKKRLLSDEGLSYAEFTYQLLQGYDFFCLFKNMGVNVQIGGSDQWGNITAGTELIRKILQVEGAYGLTFPLLLKSDGSKFGKSESGAIWLSPVMLSPYKFYQYFFSVPDVDVVRFLKILTFLKMEEIQQLEEAMMKPDYAPNSAQRRLAEEVTRFVHGEEGLAEAVKATDALNPGSETEIDPETIEAIAKDVPSFSMAYDHVFNSLLVEISVSSGLLSSKSAARRLVKQGGFYLNNKRVDNEDKVIEKFDIVGGKILLLSAGKKNKMIIKGNIQTISVADLDKYSAHVWLLSPPCQPYTRQGLQKDSADSRASSFLWILDLIPQMQQPPLMLFIENVVGFEISNTHKHKIDIFDKACFTTQEYILSPLQFGIPYSRPRYFCLAKRKPLGFKNPSHNYRLCHTLTSLVPSEDTTQMDGMLPEIVQRNCYLSCLPIRNFLETSSLMEFDSDHPDSEADASETFLEKYAVPHNLIERWGNAMDIVFPNSKRCCCFTKSYFRYVKGTGSLLATAENSNYNTAKSSGISIMKDLGLRYFTPREVANLHSFPFDFCFPEHITVRQQYALLGNSLSIAVVAPLLQYLFAEFTI